MSSYEHINYSLRPAKHIERRMIADALTRLVSFGRLADYQYVGFGSTYFSAFSLFHRMFGITDMTSIEMDESKRDRFEFNRPYSAIRLVFGRSSDVLPELSWERRAIVWLDYDAQLDEGVMGDVRTVAGVLTSGSVLIVTVNAHNSGNEADSLAEYEARMGKANVPLGLTGGHLQGWGLARIGRDALQEAVEIAIENRNVRTPNHLAWRQLFNFQYADGARMSTVGWIIYDRGQAGHLASCGFDEFAFVRDSDSPCRIQVPTLTFKELRLLNEQLPAGPDTAALEGPSIPEADKSQYASIYRYFPRFVDADV